MGGFKVKPDKNFCICGKPYGNCLNCNINLKRRDMTCVNGSDDHFCNTICGDFYYKNNRKIIIPHYNTFLNIIDSSIETYGWKKAEIYFEKLIKNPKIKNVETENNIYVNPGAFSWEKTDFNSWNEIEEYTRKNNYKEITEGLINNKNDRVWKIDEGANIVVFRIRDYQEDEINKLLSDGRKAYVDSIKKQNKKNNRTPLTKSIRHEVFKKDNYKCVECGITKKETSLHVDHIIPVSRGGTDELSNLQTLCKVCNLSKANRIYEIQEKVVK